MELGISGRLAIVTGASRGIGFACAEALLNEGVRVVLVARSQEGLDQAVEKLQAQREHVGAIAVDLVDPAATRQAFAAIVERFGVPDILVNSAGAARHTEPDKLDFDVWRSAHEAKFSAVMNMIDVARPALVARGSGVIVNIIGTGGKIPTTVHLPGGAANAALMLATNGLAKALGPKGIRVVGINPAGTVTDRFYEGRKNFAAMYGTTEEELDRQTLAGIPLRRYAEPADVANLAAFLVSERASYLTGIIVPVDGGAQAVI